MLRKADMLDVVFVLSTFLFFWAAWVFAKGCERL
jgi:hypothetical protein